MTFDKLTGIADLLDALTAVIDSDSAFSFFSFRDDWFLNTSLALTVASIDAAALLTLLSYLVSRLPASTAASPTNVLIFTRISSLLASLSTSLPSPSPKNVAQLFYSTTMALSFVRYEAGIKENEQDKSNWQKAISLGLSAGVEELRQEVLRLQ